MCLVDEVECDSSWHVLCCDGLYLTLRPYSISFSLQFDVRGFMVCEFTSHFCLNILLHHCLNMLEPSFTKAHK